MATSCSPTVLLGWAASVEAVHWGHPRLSTTAPLLTSDNTGLSIKYRSLYVPFKCVQLYNYHEGWLSQIQYSFIQRPCRSGCWRNSRHAVIAVLVTCTVLYIVHLRMCRSYRQHSPTHLIRGSLLLQWGRSRSSVKSAITWEIAGEIASYAERFTVRGDWPGLYFRFWPE